MHRDRSIPRVTTRLVRWSALGMFAFTALLGSGGLHIFAPHACSDHLCSISGHSHAGYQHAHACCKYSHAKKAETPVSAPTQPPCDPDGCVVCRNMATLAVTPAPVLLECSEPLAAVVESIDRHSPLGGAPLLTAIRGPPSVA